MMVFVFQEKHLRLWIFECKQPSHEAFQLGLAAAILLSVAHVIANLLGGCSVCSQDEFEKASPSRQLSLACLVFTWSAHFSSFLRVTVFSISHSKVESRNLPILFWRFQSNYDIIEQDHTGHRIIHAGDRDTFEQKIKSLVRLHRAPFSVHRRDSLHGPWNVFSSLLRHGHHGIYLLRDSSSALTIM